MSEDVSNKEWWTLFARMSDVINTHGWYVRSTGVTTTVVVRWDTAIFSSSRVPADVFSAKLLGCLKRFEELFIHHRHIELALLNQFIAYCNSRGDCTARLVEHENAKIDAHLSERFVKCTIQLNEFTFSYWNNDILPNMGFEVVC